MTCEDRSGPAGADAPPPRIVCGDHFDPEVGTWVMDDPRVPWRPLLKSLWQDCESIQAHSSWSKGRRNPVFLTLSAKTREKGEEKQPKTKINTLLTLLVANSREKAEQEQVIYKPKDCSNSWFAPLVEFRRSSNQPSFQVVRSYNSDKKLEANIDSSVGGSTKTQI